MEVPKRKDKTSKRKQSIHISLACRQAIELARLVILPSRSRVDQNVLTHHFWLRRNPRTHASRKNQWLPAVASLTDIREASITSQ